MAFTVDGLRADSDIPFPFDASITIWRDTVRWFVGRVTAIRREASGNAERVTYQVAGPWWYLERLVYQQTWEIAGQGQVHQSHCLLNTFADGTAMDTRQQISDALNWASTRAQARYGIVPFQWEPNALPLVNIPQDEVRDITCAEVMRKQLRWIPDAVTWFDYSASPPIFRCARRAQLPQVSIPFGPPVSSVVMVPRHDLVIPAVALKYERIDTVDGGQGRALFIDAAPSGATGQEFGALCATIDLQGFSVSSVTATILTKKLPNTHSTWLAWLKDHQPWLKDQRIGTIDISSVVRDITQGELPFLPNELLQGQVPDWIPHAAHEEQVTIKATLQVLGDDGQVLDDEDKVFSVRITTTSAPSGTYGNVTQFVEGEQAPFGLAASLYQALSVLEWQGGFSLVESEISGRVSIGQRLNITGGRPEWSTMAAMVQEISEDVDMGTTQISVGPPQHLGPRDIVELLRVNRFRFVYTSAAARNNPSVGNRGETGLGKLTPKENGDGGTTGRRRTMVEGPQGRIILDQAQCFGHTLAVKEVSICINGARKHMLILASDPY